MTDKLLIEALENCKAALASADPVRFHWEVTQATKAIAAHRSQQEAAKEPISLPEMQATGKRERAAFMGEFGNSSEEYRAWAWQGWQARAARAGKASTLMEAAAARVAAMSEDEYAEKVRDAASHPLSKINQDTEMNTIHSMTLDSLADDLGRLLMEEDLQDEKLREASEDLLPRLHDTIRKHLNELKRPGMTPGGAQVALQDVNFVPAASAAPSESEARKPLTVQQMNVIYRSAFGLIDSRLVGQQIDFVRAIEAAHGITDAALSASGPDCCAGGPQWGHAWDCKSLP